MAAVSSTDVASQLARLPDEARADASNAGAGNAALAAARAAGGTAPPTSARVFEAPYLAHAPMEPMNCTAHVQANRCHVWVPTQSQTTTQQAAMAATGLPESQVFVHTQY